MGNGIIAFLVIGAIAGYLAGRLMKGGGFGLLGNIVIGIIGAFVGGHLFAALSINIGGFVGSIVTATAGAALTLFIVSKVKK